MNSLSNSKIFPAGSCLSLHGTFSYNAVVSSFAVQKQPLRRGLNVPCAQAGDKVPEIPDRLFLVLIRVKS